LATSKTNIDDQKRRKTLMTKNNIDESYWDHGYKGKQRGYIKTSDNPGQNFSFVCEI
jgi:hypothetical protein